MKPHRHKKRTFLDSFYYALNGLKFTIYSQTNMQIHLIIGGITIGFGFYFKLTTIEWLVLIGSIFLVLIAETFNTAIEISIDLVTRKKKYRAMLAKDIAAGAVFLSTINALCVGYLLFFHRFVTLLKGG